MPTVRPTRPGSTEVSSRPQPSTAAVATKATTNRRPGSGPVVGLGLTDATNINLVQAKTNVGPKTQTALNDALSGQLLTDEDVSYLKGALQKNPKLTAAQRAASASALQEDAAAKRRLKDGSGKGTVVINGAGGGSETGFVTTGGATTGESGVATTGGTPTGASGVVMTEGAIGGGNLQSVRYLCVTNRTGQTLTVYAQTPDLNRPWQWTFEPGERAVLSIKGNWIAADKAWVWAEAGNKEWTANKEEAVVLVEQPYEADGIDTFTYAFDP
jgi:hypothetical protein